jgi:hypothetical protein
LRDGIPGARNDAPGLATAGSETQQPEMVCVE